MIQNMIGMESKTVVKRKIGRKTEDWSLQA